MLHSVGDIIYQKPFAVCHGSNGELLLTAEATHQLPMKITTMDFSSFQVVYDVVWTEEKNGETIEIHGAFFEYKVEGIQERRKRKISNLADL
jgi:hypothetical protein